MGEAAALVIRIGNCVLWRCRHANDCAPSASVTSHSPRLALQNGFAKGCDGSIRREGVDQSVA